MREVGNMEDYATAVGDAYVVQPNFAAFQDGTLFGVVAWGRPTVDDARAIVRAREREIAGTGKHALVLDYRLIEVIDPESFGCLAAWVERNHARLGAVTTRAALIKPSNRFAAATVAGFYNVVGSPYPSQLCATIEEAEAWLAVPLAATLTALDAATATRRGVTSALGEQLEQAPTLGMDDAARLLGLTPRTLQRRLRDEGTTFRAESRRARIRRAKYLLIATDDKLLAVAHAVGCSTSQHLCELFQAETGMSPTAWRDRVGKRGG